MKKYRYKIHQHLSPICTNCGMLEHFEPVIKIADDENLCFKCYRKVYGPIEKNILMKHKQIKCLKLIKYYDGKLARLRKKRLKHIFGEMLRK